jgi:hypothetical protein
MVSISKEAPKIFRAFGPMHFYRSLRAAAALQREIKMWCWCSCMIHSARSRGVLAGHFLISDAQLFVNALGRGGKTQRGRRIVLDIYRIIII